jgi:hypothetical protein
MRCSTCGENRQSGKIHEHGDFGKHLHCASCLIIEKTLKKEMEEENAFMFR